MRGANAPSSPVSVNSAAITAAIAMTSVVEMPASTVGSSGTPQP